MKFLTENFIKIVREAFLVAVTPTETVFEHWEWKHLTVVRNGGFELSGLLYVRFTGRRLNVRPQYDTKTVNFMERRVQTAVVCNMYVLTTLTDCRHTQISQTLAYNIAAASLRSVNLPICTP